MKLSLLLCAAGAAAISFTPLYAQDAGPSVREGEAQRVPVKGEITVVNKFTGVVSVKTQQIPGLEGKSMTVWYAPKDTAEINALKEGEQIKGELVVSGSDTHLENVAPTGKSSDKSKDSSAKKSSKKP